MLQPTGIPAYRDGTFIALPNVHDRSGARLQRRQLPGRGARARPAAGLCTCAHGLAPRVVLVAAAMMIAALANGLRVALIGVLATTTSGRRCTARSTCCTGCSSPAIGHVALFVGLWLLGSTRTARRGGAPAGRPAVAAPRRRGRRRRDRRACALALAARDLAARRDAGAGAAGGALDGLPAVLGPWHADPCATPPTPRLVAGRGSAAESSLPGRRRDVDRPGRVLRAQRQSHEVISFRSADLHRAAVNGDGPGGRRRHARRQRGHVDGRARYRGSRSSGTRSTARRDAALRRQAADAVARRSAAGGPTAPSSSLSRPSAIGRPRRDDPLRGAGRARAARPRRARPLPAGAVDQG